MSSKQQRPAENLESVFDRVLDETEGEDALTVDDVLRAFQGRLFGPLLLVPGLLLITPLGAIPFAPALIGVIIALVVGQRVFGKRTPWIPKRLRTRGVNRDKLVNVFDRLRPWARRIDRVLRTRLPFLVTGWMDYVIALIAFALALTLPVIGWIPFAPMAPGLAFALFGLAVTARDGAVALFGYAASIGAGWLVYWALTHVANGAA